MSPEFESRPTSEDYVGCPMNADKLRSLAKIFDESPLVTTKELAQALELTERRVLQLVEEGFLLKAGRNQFNLHECIHNFIRYHSRLVIKERLDLES